MNHWCQRSCGWFVYVEPSLHFWCKCHLIVAFKLVNMLFNSVCQHFIVNSFIFVFHSPWEKDLEDFFYFVTVMGIKFRVLFMPNEYLLHWAVFQVPSLSLWITTTPCIPVWSKLLLHWNLCLPLYSIILVFHI